MVTPVLAAIWAGELGQAESWLQTIDTGPAAPEWTSAVANWLRALIAERRGDQRAALEILRGQLSQAPGPFRSTVPISCPIWPASNRMVATGAARSTPQTPR
jgi:hypothetical protein